MFRTIYDRLASLTFGLWLMGGVIVLLAIGSFSSGGAESGNINQMPLFAWLTETPVAVSWWLWAAIGVLGLLVVNTGLCSIESIRGRYRSTRLLILIAPQIMHAGFLLIVLAHLLSASGGMKQVMPVHEGEVIAFADGTGIQVTNITAAIGPMGFPTDYSAELRLLGGSRQLAQAIRPNEPFFYEGAGFYLKEVALQPYRAALIEIHREPGAGCALAGALFFMAGNVLLLYVRRGGRAVPVPSSDFPETKV